jgi:multiple sugar transport system substrate-binding protein
MAGLSRRSLLRGSVGLAAAGALARPYIANAAATTATAWWVQGFVPEEDAAFRKMVADYEKQSSNKIDYSIIPFAPMRQKEIAAVSSGVVPDVINAGDFYFVLLSAWKGQLLDVSDVVETQKDQFSKSVLSGIYAYDSAAKKRAYYAVPRAATTVPIHLWKSLVEKGGGKVAELANLKWDAFLDSFKPVQDGLRKAGMRNVYAYGYQLTANGVDPNNTFAIFNMAYGGKDIVTPDGKLHTDDPKIKEAAVKALTKLTTPFKDGYVPPVVTNWNDADDNNAFHSKLIVMDFDGTISTEVALFHKKDEYDDIMTMGYPANNEGEKFPAQLLQSVNIVPKGAKNVEVAKEFLKYSIEPKVSNEYLKGGLGRWLPTMPAVAHSDPFWLKGDPHVAAYATQGLIDPTIAPYETFNPAWADINTQHVMEVAEFDVMNSGMAPEKAVDKAFKRFETIFAKYPIVEG